IVAAILFTSPRSAFCAVASDKRLRGGYSQGTDFPGAFVANVSGIIGSSFLGSAFLTAIGPSIPLMVIPFLTREGLELLKIEKMLVGRSLPKLFLTKSRDAINSSIDVSKNTIPPIIIPTR